MELSAFIDWISVTHKGVGNAPLHDKLPTPYTPTNGMNGYTVAKKYTTGVIEMVNPARPSMGTHIIYSGKVLQSIHDKYGVTRDEILQFHTTLKGRISRIDFAVDIRNSNLDLARIWNELESSQAVTLSRHSRTQSGKNRGDTVYVGSRKARKKLLRVYDKAKELGDFVSDYKRIELETRQDVARNSSRLYQDNNYSTETILSMVRKFCDFPNYGLWTEIFNCTPLRIPVGDKTIGNTEKWLLEQCAPAMARVMHDNPEFFSVWLEQVQREYAYIEASKRDNTAKL